MLSFWNLVIGVIQSHILLGTLFQPPDIGAFGSTSGGYFGNVSVPWLGSASDVQEMLQANRRLPSLCFVSSVDIYRPDLKELAVLGQILLQPVCKRTEKAGRTRKHILEAIGSQEHVLHFARFGKTMIISPLNQITTVPRHLPATLPARTALGFCQAETNARTAYYGDPFASQSLGEDQALVASALYAFVMLFCVVFILKKGKLIKAYESGAALRVGPLNQRFEYVISGAIVERCRLVLPSRSTAACEETGADNCASTPTVLKDDIADLSLDSKMDGSSDLPNGLPNSRPMADPTSIPFPDHNDDDASKDEGPTTRDMPIDPAIISLASDGHPCEGEDTEQLEPESMGDTDKEGRILEFEEVPESTDRDKGEPSLMVDDMPLEPVLDGAYIDQAEDKTTMLVIADDSLEPVDKGTVDSDDQQRSSPDKEVTGDAFFETLSSGNRGDETGITDGSTDYSSDGSDGHHTVADVDMSGENISSIGESGKDIEDSVNMPEQEVDNKERARIHSDDPYTWTPNVSDPTFRPPTAATPPRPTVLPDITPTDRPRSPQARATLIASMRQVGFACYHFADLSSDYNESDSMELQTIDGVHLVLEKSQDSDEGLKPLLNETLGTSVLEAEEVPGHQEISGVIFAGSESALGGDGDCVDEHKGKSIQVDSIRDPARAASTLELAPRWTSKMKAKLADKLGGLVHGGKAD